jgi:hypothetical protein
LRPKVFLVWDMEVIYDFHHVLSCIFSEFSNMLE